MKKKGPSNVFTVPNWMKNLKVREPEGTYTPDQVTAVLELNLMLNDSDVVSLRACIKDLVSKVPLKRQKVLKAFLAMEASQMLVAVNEFIAKVNASLVQFIQEKVDVRIEAELPSTSGESGPDAGDEWGIHDGRVLGKPSARGRRAVRNAKRQAFES